jgi:hypothetical protein
MKGEAICAKHYPETAKKMQRRAQPATISGYGDTRWENRSELIITQAFMALNHGYYFSWVSAGLCRFQLLMEY